jgi:transcriptional regulator with XRE-family HTH domain
MARSSPGGLDELSLTLRQLREDAGLNGLQAADVTGFSNAKISRVERGLNVPTPEDVATFVRAYRAEPDVCERLIGLAEDVKAANRRLVIARRPNRAEFQKRLNGIESASEQLRSFSPIIVPGLLQTAEYIRAIFETGGGTPEEIAQAVAARLGRQAVLDEPGRRITILTTEGALGWAAGPPPLMVRQMEHIAVVSRKDTVRVGIIPFGTPATVFPVSNWDLYDERAAVPGVLRTQLILQDPDVTPYVEQFQLLEPLAVYGTEARAILARVADRYRDMSSRLA